MLDAYWRMAAPLITRRFGGELEKFIGDAMMATFNRRGDQPDHALRAARAALALQREAARLAERHPDWPRSGEVLSRTLDPSLAFPTTIAIARGRLLVVNSQFDKRGGAPTLPFTVSSIKLP